MSRCRGCSRPPEVMVFITWHGLFRLPYRYCLDCAVRVLNNHRPSEDVELVVGGTTS